MQSWKENFKEGEELVLATSSKSGKPNANIVISLGFTDRKLLIADCQMKTTIQNLKENSKISIISGYYRLKGNVKVLRSGKYYEICKEKNRKYKVKHAIVVDVKEVFDLDNMKKIL